MPRSTRRRDQRGVVFPSPVVILSVIAVAMAGVAYVATQGQEPTEREVTTVARPAEESASPTQQLPAHKPKKIEKRDPVVKRGKVYVEVYNNSGITGLAGTTAAKASSIGWQVVATDNWYGTIPASTVYFPPRLREAAKQLSLDLGVQRMLPAVEPMRFDRLTVVLTSDAA